jgi:hypothetical protein
MILCYMLQGVSDPEIIERQERGRGRRRKRERGGRARAREKGRAKKRQRESRKRRKVCEMREATRILKTAFPEC